MNLHSRFYEDDFPLPNQVVTVKIVDVDDAGAHAVLLEYNDMVGLIVYNELSKRRIRSVNKVAKIGTIERVVVVNVDRDKGYIDLSKKRILNTESESGEEKFNKAKAVNSILRHVAETQKMDISTLYQSVAWPLDRKYGSQGYAYEAFKLSINDQNIISSLELGFDVHNDLIMNIKLRMSPPSVKIRAEISVTCFSYEGIEGIKKALRVGLSNPAIKINLKASPYYTISIVTSNREVGIKIIEEAIEGIKKCIEELGGELSVIIPPGVVSEADEKVLERELKILEEQQIEKDGDDLSTSSAEEEKDASDVEEEK